MIGRGLHGPLVESTQPLKISDWTLAPLWEDVAAAGGEPAAPAPAAMDWTPWLIGGGFLLVLMMGGR